ncbi:MAG: hypothetical protein JSU91_04610 [Thermoplasmatales archaeon]|nr:MAG: hypothetical protein JSU91_04610 [Thermoplasmatales archaeon]
MDRNPAMLYKTLVVGVIVIFIGVGIQPAVAELSNISKSDSKDDCNLCPKKISKSHIILIESLLNRLEKYDNKLSILFKNNPEIEKRNKAFSNRFLILKEINKNFIFYWNFPIICTFLNILIYSYIFLIIFALFIVRIYHDFPFFHILIDVIIPLGFKLNCSWYIEPPPHLLKINKLLTLN